MTDRERIQDDLRVARLALGVARQIDLAGAARAMVRAVLDYGRLSAGFLYLYDDEHDIFHLKACHLADDDPRVRSILSLDLEELRGEGPAATWTPAIARPPAALQALGDAPMLVVPLPGAGALLGMLLAGDGRSPIDSAAADRVGRLVPELLPALVNAALVERYRSLVIMDDQTACFNRRHFDRVLSEEVYRAHRYGTTLALIFLDLDNLKEINAGHGHAAGSRTVREVARRLVGMVRGSDRVFRYGGDEFCVVLPGTDLQGAGELAERLRHCLGDRAVPLAEAPGLFITASLGIAAYPTHARTSQGLVKCADAAMQQAKRCGKNSVAVACADEPEPARASEGAS